MTTRWKKKVMNKRGFNFGAGPSMLPELILKEVQDELFNWHGLDMSILEINHRTFDFQELLTEAEIDLRQLLNIPDEYAVLFLGGAARTQFAMIPLNLLNGEEKAGYLISGIWSKLAFEEAVKIKKAYCVASSEAQGFAEVPTYHLGMLQENTRYLFYTPNETVNGNRFALLPNAEGIPLIADMTSCLLSEPINIRDYALIFAGAQKNISIAGLTIVIMQRELCNRQPVLPIPTMLDYQTHIDHHSLYATPPIFNCYIAAKMFKWIKKRGGIQALHQINCKKAELLYGYIDASKFYQCPVRPESRSLMNVCFTLPSLDLETEFLEEAKQHKLYALKGHRTVGGLRASIYNAMPIEGVYTLINFMQAFCEEHNS
jgi:phosphoserine aminotransferase